jgi:hypothetical protein
VGVESSGGLGFGGKDQALNSTARTLPTKAKKKVTRGHTVHDASEFEDVELNDVNADEALRTLRKSSPTRSDVVVNKRSSLGGVGVGVHTLPKASSLVRGLEARTSMSAVVTSQPMPSSSLLLNSHPPSTAPSQNPLRLQHQQQQQHVPAYHTSTQHSLPQSYHSNTTPSPRNTDSNRAFQTQLVPELSQQSGFFSLHKVPSRSSTSSDVQSEVCVDLHDYAEDASGGGPPGSGRDRHSLTLGFPSAPYGRINGVGRRTTVEKLASWSGTFFVLLASLVLFIPVLVLVLVLVPVCLLVKWLCGLCCCCCGPRHLWGRCCVGTCHVHLTATEKLWVERVSTLSHFQSAIFILHAQFFEE